MCLLPLLSAFDGIIQKEKLKYGGGKNEKGDDAVDDPLLIGIIYSYLDILFVFILF